MTESRLKQSRRRCRQVGAREPQPPGIRRRQLRINTALDGIANTFRRWQWWFAARAGFSCGNVLRANRSRGPTGIAPRVRPAAASRAAAVVDGPGRGVLSADVSFLTSQTAQSMLG